MPKNPLFKCPFQGGEKPREASCGVLTLAVLDVANPIGEVISSSVEEQPWVKIPSLNLMSLNDKIPSA